MKQQFFYRTIKNGSKTEAELLRCFGETGEVLVPAQLEGFPVTSIGPYCFARTRHLPAAYEKISLPDPEAFSGKAPEAVIPSGNTPEGAASSGNAPEGAASSGNAPEGAAPSGKAPEVAASGGNAPEAAAPDRHAREEYVSPAGWGNCLEEQAGSRVEKVVLPDTITKFDAYAFYNCRKLKELSFPASVEIIGNDAFMNCTSLSDLYVNTASGQPSGLRQILAQITWNVEVHFTDAAVFFPEYLEYYDEIGPAHVFEMQVEGEGFRIRKAFRDGILQLPEYDAVFPKLSAEEAVKLTIRFAANRLLYPVELTEEHKEWFGTFLSAHEAETACLLFEEEKYPLTQRLKQLHQLFLQKWLGSAALDALMAEAAEKQMPEAAANFIKWKQELFGTKKKKRYEFDDF